MSLIKQIRLGLSSRVRVWPLGWMLGANVVIWVLLVSCAPNQLTPQTPAATTEKPPTATLTATPTVIPTPVPETPTATAEVRLATQTPPPTDFAPDLPPPVSFGYTHQRPDGNRLVAGQGALPGAQPVDIPLAGEPRWLVAASTEEGSLWAVVLADSRVQAFQVVAGQWAEVLIDPEQLLPGTPPHLKIQAGEPTLLTAPMDAPSPTTHPVVLKNTGQLVFIHASGEVIIWNEPEVDRLAVNALPDARLLRDESDRLLLLTGATTRYGHGVLGDPIEAASITLIETLPTPQVAIIIPIPEPTVVEGIAPIWADLTGDGGREIIVTLSNATQGAQVVVFDETGQQLAAGPAIGQGNRWRHQIAVAPFGPEGELELVDVLTPHIGGVVEFYRLEGDTLRIVAQVPGYTSHVIGTRNLDMAVAGDFDGDGHVELLLPNQARTELGAIRRTVDGAEVAWTVAVEGVVNTNLAAVTLADNHLAIGLGRQDGLLRLWLP